MLTCDSERVQRRKASRLAPRLHIELCADAPNEFRPASFRGQHPGQKKQIAGLHRFRVGAKRLRRRRELDAKFFQPLLGAGRPRVFASYHLPACAPPSTCNISPVVKAASIKNKTASTTSLTSPILPTGCNSLRNSWVSCLCIGVLMVPNATVFTRMPSLAYSIASARVTYPSPKLGQSTELHPFNNVTDLCASCWFQSRSSFWRGTTLLD